MDEATSSLDASNEKDVKTAIDQIIESGNLTVIIVAHRLSTIYDADRIIMIEDGKIIE